MKGRCRVLLLRSPYHDINTPRGQSGCFFRCSDRVAKFFSPSTGMHQCLISTNFPVDHGFTSLLCKG
ncbi:unnamed protein product [Penicillium camemberti]|uniref:Str. FM013 n=1 Tax=Penicillium camemberti (strain FM 013) TaxID=1429867 RepID=A0A0G4P5R4_PENC3|nr:unnamed protein product [Penicillium camemberti]